MNPDLLSKPSPSSSNPPLLFDLDSYLSRYQPLSNITLKRLLFLSRNTTDQNISKLGYKILEERLKRKGNIVLYRQLFGHNDKNNNNNNQNDSMDLDENENLVGGEGSVERMNANTSFVIENEDNDNMISSEVGKLILLSMGHFITNNKKYEINLTNIFVILFLILSKKKPKMYHHLSQWTFTSSNKLNHTSIHNYKHFKQI